MFKDIRPRLWLQKRRTCFRTSLEIAIAVRVQLLYDVPWDPGSLCLPATPWLVMDFVFTFAALSASGGSGLQCKRKGKLPMEVPWLIFGCNCSHDLQGSLRNQYQAISPLHPQLKYCWIGSAVKDLPANAGDAGSIPGSGRPPGGGNGNPLQYSCLGNSMDREAWQTTVHGVKRVRHDLVAKQQHINSWIAMLC